MSYVTSSTKLNPKQTTASDLKPNMGDAKLLAEALKDQNKDYRCSSVVVMRSSNVQ